MCKLLCVKEKQRHARLEQGLSSEDDLEFDPAIPGLGRKEARVGSSSRGGILRRPSVIPQSDSILDQLMRLHLGRGKGKDGLVFISENVGLFYWLCLFRLVSEETRRTVETAWGGDDW